MRRPDRPSLIALALAAFPVLVWMVMSPFSARWASGPDAIRSFSQLTGIIGFALFAYVMIISARFHWMERILGPLDRIYAAHHTLGVTAFSLLLAHPVFAIWYVLALRQPDVAHYILPGLDNALTWGILSLWTLAFLIVLTIYLRPRYGVWRTTHKFLGLALFLASLHGFFISSDISASPLLRWYLLGLALVALLVFSAYTILNRVFVQRYAYRVARIDPLSDAVVSLRLTPVGRPLPSVPGRFVFVRFMVDGAWSEVHPFSITSPADSTQLGVSFKALGDDTERFVERLQKDAAVQVEGPFGAFGSQFSDASHVVCIAGGIGVTPFLSLLSSLDPSRTADVYYAVRNAQEAAHLPLLRAQEANSAGRIRVTPWFSDEHGYLTADVITDQRPLAPTDRVFLCGPLGFMRALRTQLTDAGFPADRIHSEEFSFD